MKQAKHSREFLQRYTKKQGQRVLPLLFVLWLVNFPMF